MVQVSVNIKKDIYIYREIATQTITPFDPYIRTTGTPSLPPPITPPNETLNGTPNGSGAKRKTRSKSGVDEGPDKYDSF